uniref:Lipocln_cytosolic_FA-bd_dom domain-containing protein n=1 Tax=Parastrongyloides trichosuri TaxID=131310 RepID=A0A0N4Z5C9_PARTI
MAEAFVGVWGNAIVENFDAYLKEVGVGFFLRTLAKTVRDRTTITVNGDKVTLLSESTFKNFSVTWTLNKEEIQETLDGRKFLTTVTVKDGKLIEVQKPIKEGSKGSVITRYIKDDKLIVELDCNGVVAKHTYTRLS